MYIYVSPKEDQWSRKENCKSVLSGGLMSPSSTVFSTETYFHISCWDFCDRVYSFSFLGTCVWKAHSLSQHTILFLCWKTWLMLKCRNFESTTRTGGWIDMEPYPFTICLWKYFPKRKREDFLCILPSEFTC